jgi:hypothetical protein
MKNAMSPQNGYIIRATLFSRPKTILQLSRAHIKKMLDAPGKLQMAMTCGAVKMPHKISLFEQDTLLFVMLLAMVLVWCSKIWARDQTSDKPGTGTSVGSK